ncbi:hypothetical protein J8273_7504 [Carpediemonas membranifera]|uniref:Uncharacterized protein n=1 Tax=Carpediemonas membranifera TaxID=201153 RepID=A0A8J6ATP7_9EUKA|nr:hypothetical protein J8273_7504 [Carpediemonas membranifera]|eukprot:KAG9391230.1 hypothetical protein J8273_7504 [Carpediemonas membranifera]
MGAGAPAAVRDTWDGLQSGQVRLPELPGSMRMVTSRIPERYVPSILSPVLSPERNRTDDEDGTDTFEHSFLMETGRQLRDSDDEEDITHSDSASVGILDDDMDDRMFMVQDDEAQEDMKAAIPLQAIARARIIRHTTKIGGELAVVSFGKELTQEKRATLKHSEGSRGRLNSTRIPRGPQVHRTPQLIGEISAETEAAIGQVATSGLFNMVSAQQKQYDEDMAGGAGTHG